MMNDDDDDDDDDERRCFLPQSVVKELFGDVMFTVGVLERQIELVTA